MKSDRPKQFIELKGKAIIIRTLEAFLAYNQHLRIVICVHRNYRQHLEGLLEKASLNGADIRITFGGETRYDSVKNGLKMIETDQGVVGIHDAARPLVSQQTIKTCFETAAQKGNAVPCVPVSESLRKISNNINTSVNRNEFKMIQTPQCFHINRIRQAFEQPYSAAFTDDATVFEASGQTVVLVEGNEENIKITSPRDLMMAQCLLP
jgi:2-C-methyl-D-erythritol 4-phosphate cytidylyltransferase